MIRDFLAKNFAKYNDKPFIGARNSNKEQFQWLTYQDIYTKSQHLASFLSKNVTIPPSDVFPFGTVCICSENRAEWLISDFACSLNGLVSVGFHSSWPLEESITIANDVYASAAIVSGTYLDYFLKIAEKQKSLKLIICMDDIECDGVIKLTDIFKMPIESYDILPNEYHTIIYSSGTTGSPKGLPITRQRWIYDALHGPFQADKRSVYLSFSALAHAMDRGIAWQLILVGGQFAISRGDHESILEDAQVIEPSLIMSMPHFWNDLYYDYKQILQNLIIRYLKNIEKVPNPSQELVDLLFSCCENKSDNPIISGILNEAREKITKSIGTKCEVIGTGGSSISDQVLDFLKEFFANSQIINSYGTTEVPGISSNGEISKNIEFKLVDCPQIGYVSNDKVKEGEIVVKMPHMVTFYWGKREQTLKSTKENFKDGWYYTQDIGRIDSEGKLSIIDRKSDLAELYVDGRSEWIPVSPIEDLFLSKSNLFKNIYMHGDRAQSFLVAVVVPKNGQKVTHHQIFHEIVRIGRESKLKKSEIPRAVIISDHEWTPESGELSQMMKLKRGNLLKKFKMEIDQEYARLNTLDEEKEKIAKDHDFDYINYIFMCDDPEDSEELNLMFRPIKDSIIKLREMGPEANKRIEENEKKVVEETTQIKTKCFNEIDHSFSQIKDDTSFFHFLNTLSQNKELITKASRRREDAHYAGDDQQMTLDAEINGQIHRLIDKANEIGENVPFQISCGLFKLSPQQIQNRNGNCLSESQAPSSWEVWCSSCGDLIEVGSHGEGTPRYKCLDCDCVYCSSCYDKLTKLREMSDAHKNWKLPFECFSKSHHLSKEFKKFLVTDLNKLRRSSDSLSVIFNAICEKYQNRILLGDSDDSNVVTYGQAIEKINGSDNELFLRIKSDIDKNDAEIMKKAFEVRIDDWPIVVKMEKGNLDSFAIWSTLYNGGRIMIEEK